MVGTDGGGSNSGWFTARPGVALGLIVVVALAARLIALPGSTERSMDPDSAHLLNVARCIERGQGFSNPGGWPAWMKPERLPMPETFKEPGYPSAIAAIAPRVGGEFRAGVLISLLAGLALPIALFFLARNLGLDRAEAALAALLLAVNPLAIFMSVRVTVDAPFPALLTAAFALAAWRPAAAGRPLWADALTGAVVGLAFMVRGQTLTAVPALAIMLAMRRARAGALLGGAVTTVVAVLVASPFLLRNIQSFGAPFHSDVGAYGIWPYVDPLVFSHGLDRPPAPIAFALTHIPEVLRHMMESAVRFAVFVLPRDIVGNPVWLPALAVGGFLSLGRWRSFIAPWAYVLPTLLFIFAVHWDSRYFTASLPYWAMLTAVGAVWVARGLGDRSVWGRVRVRHVLVAVAVIASVVQIETARRNVARLRSVEIEAAIAEAPFLRERLAPDEAVMVVTTSFYSWFADRPSVHLVIADEARFAETVRRLKVRYAALPTSRLAEFAERYPGRRLPRALVFDHADEARDVTVFAVRAPDGAAAP
jgi:hypothetical protein